ncbi:NAD-dependent epimerase/dehydratase family protein [Sphingobacterium bovistauri]|uniref:NAD-dependent epimerase/dehydratase family protein n=1 Tax=Sphingobacterium bovistauri TaxID=2781959 RepID=A0ABS7Z8J7_9SPHI|nr:NAD-dependent epimerase/dehydratase family protein [Sphingobacterium bovistauri]MCA5005274.1 NAD-dependent epimerase/dehydratase family protein [Sphingobacterium bovistauri]
MRILILGCGWVGEEIAKYYIDKGFEVYATCTSEEKKNYLNLLGLHVAIVDFDKENSILEFPTTFNYVLNSIPASSKNSVDEISNRFAHVSNYLKNITYQRQLYLSSIGIYPDKDGIFTEDFADDLNERLFVAEQKITFKNTHIYRLGGLFGNNRIFAKYFENRICSTGDQLANFIHVDDVVELIVQGFETDLNHPIYNLVAPEHPPKKEVILASAQKYNFQLPSDFQPEHSFQKMVDGSKIIKELNYSFKYISPLDF